QVFSKPKSTQRLGAEQSFNRLNDAEFSWTRSPHWFFFGRSLDRRQAYFGQQLLEDRLAVQPDELLVIAKIQHPLVMRLDADGEIPDCLALVAQPGLGLCHKIG